MLMLMLMPGPALCVGEADGLALGLQPWVETSFQFLILKYDMTSYRGVK